MKQELKDKWIAALRSGEYQQGRAQLYDEATGAFCCLGVLCKVADIAISEDGISCMVDGIEEGYKPLKDMINEDVTICWKMNDFDGASFDNIASWIETNVKAD